MREKLVKRWIEVGAPNVDDLGSMIGVGGVDLFRIFAGRKDPDQRTAAILAKLFDLQPGELFDEACPPKAKTQGNRGGN